MKKTHKSTASTNIKTLKTASCPTLSGKSQLTYAIGIENGTGELHLKLVAGTGGGFFDKSFVPYSGILDALKSIHPVTSLPLRDVYRGKSVNSSGFLLAVLLKEGVLERIPDKTKQFSLAADAESYPQRYQDGKVKPAKKAKAASADKKAAASPQKVPPQAKKAPHKTASA